MSSIDLPAGRRESLRRLREEPRVALAVTDGVQWHWSDEESEQRDAAVRAALARPAA